MFFAIARPFRAGPATEPLPGPPGLPYPPSRDLSPGAAREWDGRAAEKCRGREGRATGLTALLNGPSSLADGAKPVASTKVYTGGAGRSKAISAGPRRAAGGGDGGEAESAAGAGRAGAGLHAGP